MAIVQISKIIHRVGANIDLPQLDTGEFGFSTDTRQVFIGNDPVLYPPALGSTTQTEILTDQSSIDFIRLNGADGASMILENPAAGEILGVGTSNGSPVITNLGGSTSTTANVTRPKINLGNVANLTITGTALNGAVLQTDGTGNLSWTAQTTGGTITNHPGGANSQLQFNDAGSFNGSSKLTFNSSSGNLTVNGNVSVSTNVTANTLQLGSWSIFANVNGIYANNGTHTYQVSLTQV